MKQVIAVLEKGIEFVQKISSIAFLHLMAVEVDGKMSLRVFSEFAGCDFF
jgi:hypothetical protein